MPNKQFRVTRPSAYRPGTIGHTDKGARQGYYVYADDADDAVRVAREEYPERITAEEPLDVQERG